MRGTHLFLMEKESETTTRDASFSDGEKERKGRSAFVGESFSFCYETKFRYDSCIPFRRTNRNHTKTGTFNDNRRHVETNPIDCQYHSEVRADQFEYIDDSQIYIEKVNSFTLQRRYYSIDFVQTLLYEAR